MGRAERNLLSATIAVAKDTRKGCVRVVRMPNSREEANANVAKGLVMPEGIEQAQEEESLNCQKQDRITTTRDGRVGREEKEETREQVNTFTARVQAKGVG